MINKEKMEKAMELLGELTAEQKAVVESLFDQKISEKEVFEKLGVDEKKFAEFIKAASDEKEKDVFDQEISLDELEGVAGGREEDTSACKRRMIRYIYWYEFPNCACTVEDGSWCINNDACYSKAVEYRILKECSKAWR